MKTISMRQFLRNFRPVIDDLRRGQTFSLTHRGNPVARLLPIAAGDDEMLAEDPFYGVVGHADGGAEENRQIDNTLIDQTLYT